MESKSKLGAVALEITFTISPAHRVEFLQTVDSLMSTMAGQPGPSSLGCFEEIGTDNAFLWRECWDSEGEVESRLQTGGIRTLMGAIGVLGKMDRVEILAASGRANADPFWT